MLEGLRGELGGALHLLGGKGDKVLGNGSERGKGECWCSDVRCFSPTMTDVCSVSPQSLGTRVSGQEVAPPKGAENKRDQQHTSR